MRYHSTGYAQPAAHAALYRCRKDLCARVARLRALPDDAFAHGFAALVDAVESGFRHEESLLELLGGADLHPCRADHGVILCALHRIQPQVENGDVALGRQVAEALDAVLAHPRTVDAAGSPPPRRHARQRHCAPARQHAARTA